MNQKQALERPDDQTTHALAVEALDEIGLVRVEIDLAESPYLLAVNQARNLGELLIEAADKLGAQGAGAMSDQEREALIARELYDWRTECALSQAGEAPTPEDIASRIRAALAAREMPLSEPERRGELRVQGHRRRRDQ